MHACRIILHASTGCKRKSARKKAGEGEMHSSTGVVGGMSDAKDNPATLSRICFPVCARVHPLSSSALCASGLSCRNWPGPATVDLSSECSCSFPLFSLVTFPLFLFFLDTRSFALTILHIPSQKFCEVPQEVRRRA